MPEAKRIAINGGAPLIADHQHRSWPEIRSADRQAVIRSLDSGILCGPNAPEISGLQDEWAEYLGVRHCIALNSGTAALHCALAAEGVGPGDEVIVPAFTFVATAMAPVYQGAIPVFCDVEPRSYNLAVDQIEELITERTRAIIPVHLHGLPADMKEINALAGHYGLAVIEDAAQAHGALYRGRKAGTLAHTAAFSLNASKNLPGGEGGLFVTDDDDAYLAARRLSTFGEDAVTAAPGQFRSYWSHGIGWNYRNQELSSALARSQLQRLDHYNETARQNAHILTRGLANIVGMVPPHVPGDRTSVYHKYRLAIDVEALGYSGDPKELRDSLLRALRAEGVQAVLWQSQPLPAQAAFRRPLRPWHRGLAGDDALEPYEPDRFPVAERILDSSIVIGSEAHPLYVQTPELMERYVEAVAKVIDQLDAVLDSQEAVAAK